MRFVDAANSLEIIANSLDVPSITLRITSQKCSLETGTFLCCKRIRKENLQKQPRNQTQHTYKQKPTAD